MYYIVDSKIGEGFAAVAEFSIIGTGWFYTDFGIVMLAVAKIQ